MFAFLLSLSDFKTKTSFGFLITKIRGRFLKSENELVRPKMVCLVTLVRIRSFSNNSDIIANLRLMSV